MPNPLDTNTIKYKWRVGLSHCAPM